jgi:hypothetical protein
MKRTGQVVAMAACLTFGSWVGAQSPPQDHLTCYKIKDPQPKASYAADLDGLVHEPGCSIKVPAVTACVPSTKTNVRPVPPGSGPSGTPGTSFCYKVKCPKAARPTLTGSDQFGSRTVTPKGATLLCAPVATTLPCTPSRPCGSGLECRDGQCVCDPASCPSGCCCAPGSSNGCLPGTPVPSCLTPDMQTDTQCGTGGIVCQVCTGGTHCSTSIGTCGPSTTTTTMSCSGWGGGCATGLPGGGTGTCCAGLTCVRQSPTSDLGLCAGATCSVPTDCPGGDCAGGHCCSGFAGQCALGCCPGLECGSPTFGTLEMCLRASGSPCTLDAQCSRGRCDPSTMTCG